MRLLAFEKLDILLTNPTALQEGEDDQERKL